MNFVKFTGIFLNLISVISFIYSIVILWASGIKTSFLWFFPTLCAVCIAFSILLNKLHRFSAVLSVLIWIGFAIFMSVEIMLISYSKSEPAKNADYIIVLGASVRGDTPSKTLYARINAAYDYLIANPDTIAICSGGQGIGENVSEAYAIARELAARGIDESRLILEENSTTTGENLKFAKQFIPGYDSSEISVILVTSDFHLYRACLLAGRYGYKNLYGLAADEFLYTTPSYYIREFFALIKEMLFR